MTSQQNFSRDKDKHYYEMFCLGEKKNYFLSSLQQYLTKEKYKYCYNIILIEFYQGIKANTIVTSSSHIMTSSLKNPAIERRQKYCDISLKG